MLKRIYLIVLLIATAFTSYAQLYIEGRRVAFDEQSHLWLATIPEAFFNESRQLKVTSDPEWSQIVIGEQVIDSTYTFQHITANSMYPAMVSNGKGSTIAGVIMFTFLPTIELNGDFGYNYTDADIAISDPELPAIITSPISGKWRGGTTNTDDRHKRNYKIKFPKDISFFHLRNDNNWLLDAGQIDPFRVRNRIATDIWYDFAVRPYYADKAPEARTATRGQLVEVFLNHRYWGVYSMSECLDRKQTQIMKCDHGTVHGCLWKAIGYKATQMKTVSEPYSPYNTLWDGFEAKYPDLSDNDTVDWTTLYDAIHFVIHSRRADFVAHVGEYFDIPALIDYYLFTNMLAAIDNHGKNMFWAVYDKEADKRITPMPWDLDCTVGQPWALRFGSQYVSPYYPLHTAIFVIERLIRSNALQFTDRTVKRYHELRKGCFSTDSLITRYRYYHDLLVNSGAAHREVSRWNGDSDLEGNSIDFDKELEDITAWIVKRARYLDLMLSSSTKLSIEANRTSQQNACQVYRLNGTKMPGSIVHQKPGIYIVQGRKYLVK